MVIFSERLRALRTLKNLSQAALADMLHISVRTIIRYENGDRVPDLDTACLLAQVLGVSLDYLCGLSDNPHPSEPFPLEGEE